MPRCGRSGREVEAGTLVVAHEDVVGAVTGLSMVRDYVDHVDGTLLPIVATWPIRLSQNHPQRPGLRFKMKRTNNRNRRTNRGAVADTVAAVAVVEGLVQGQALVGARAGK